MKISNSLSRPFDAIVVGARCAGASTAMLMARAGMKVLVIDKDQYGDDTLSTHMLMRGGVMQLDRWGLMGEIKAGNTPPVRATTFHYGQSDIPTVRIDMKPVGEAEGLYAPRRTSLDTILVDAAMEAGADIRFGWRLKALKRNHLGAVCGIVAQHECGDEAHFAAPLVIGADGKNSAVAKFAGAKTIREASASSACLYGYFEGLQPAGYNWCYAPELAAGTAPTSDGLTCAFVTVPDEYASEAFKGSKDEVFRSLFAKCAPDLAPWLENSRSVEKYHIFAGIRGFVRETVGPGWALVGDAAYFKDPMTAHGITDALRDAELLARAAYIGSPKAFEDYVTTRDELSEDLFVLTEAIASFSWEVSEVQGLLMRLAMAMQAENDMLAQLPDIGDWATVQTLSDALAA